MRSVLAAIAATLALAACQSKPAANVVEPVDPMSANVTTGNVAVELPPSIKSSKAYRCKDNSLAYVDLFQGDRQATVRDTPSDTPVMLKGEAGQALTAPGYELTVKGSTLVLNRPGHPKQECDG